MTMTEQKPTPSAKGLEVPGDLQTEERQKSDEQVFQEVLKKHRPGREAAEAAEKAPVAPPEEKKEDQPEEKPQPEGQAPPTEEPDPKTEEPSAPSAERTAAEQFLRLKAGVPQSALEGLDDEAVLAWAEERRTREATVDAAFARAKRAEKESSEPTDSQATDDGEQQPTPKEDLQAVAQVFADDLDLTDEGRDRLGEGLEKLLAPLRDEIAALKETQQTTSQRDAMQVIQSVRQQVGERFPGLADDATFERVVARAKALEGLPEYGGGERSFTEYGPELFTEVACALQLEDKGTPEEAAAAREAAQRERERQERIDAGSGADPSSPPAPTRPPTKQEADWTVFQKIKRTK